MRAPGHGPAPVSGKRRPSIRRVHAPYVARSVRAPGRGTHHRQRRGPRCCRQNCQERLSIILVQGTRPAGNAALGNDRIQPERHRDLGLGQIHQRHRDHTQGLTDPEPRVVTGHRKRPTRPREAFPAGAGRGPGARGADHENAPAAAANSSSVVAPHCHDLQGPAIRLQRKRQALRRRCTAEGRQGEPSTSTTAAPSPGRLAVRSASSSNIRARRERLSARAHGAGGRCARSPCAISRWHS